jgi:hypothetical protein
MESRGYQKRTATSTTSIASLGAGGKTKTRKELHGFWFLRFYFYWFIDV